ncbi:MAG: TadE family protein [Candidatus Ozemobacteraceae bacterium]
MINQRKWSAKGQMIVEFAFVFPFFLLVIFGGLIDFGIAFNNILTLQEIANAAAQAGGDAGVADAASSAALTVNNLRSQLNLQLYSNFEWSSELASRADAVGGYSVISVHVKANSRIFTPFYQTMFGAISGSPSLPIVAQAVYPILQNKLNNP